MHRQEDGDAPLLDPHAAVAADDAPAKPIGQKSFGPAPLLLDTALDRRHFFGELTPLVRSTALRRSSHYLTFVRQEERYQTELPPTELSKCREMLDEQAHSLHANIGPLSASYMSSIKNAVSKWCNSAELPNCFPIEPFNEIKFFAAVCI